MLLNKFQIPRSILLSICLIPNLQSHISNDHLHRLEAKSKILIPHFTCLNSKFSFSSLHAQTQSSHPPLHMHMLKLKILILQSTCSNSKFPVAMSGSKHGEKKALNRFSRRRYFPSVTRCDAADCEIRRRHKNGAQRKKVK